MEERKSMGGALVDVFDAGVVLVKSEINGVVKKVTEVAKAKGIGAVLLLGAVGPLLMGLIFLILFVFYGLMRLGMAAWGAALVIAILSLVLAAALAVLGIQKLSAEVDASSPRRPVTPDELKPGMPTAAVAPAQSQGTHTARTASASAVPLSSVRVAGMPDTAAAPQPDGYVQVSTEQGHTTLPVYESKTTGEPQMYSTGLNKKVEAREHRQDPNLQNPVVVQGAPGISVSTDPTYREDMKKEGY